MATQEIQWWLFNQFVGVLFGALVMGVISWFFHTKKYKDVDKRLKTLEGGGEDTLRDKGDDLKHKVTELEARINRSEWDWNDFKRLHPDLVKDFPKRD